MSRIDLHVDELFDGARTGSLSTLEAARLHAHCAQCVACRAELDWVGDGLHLGVASDDDRERAARAVEALLGGGLQDATQASESRSSSRVRAATVSRLQAAALVCLGLLMASAGAALYAEVQAWRAREAAAVAEKTAQRSEQARAAARAKAQRRVPATAASGPAPVEASAAPVPAASSSTATPEVGEPEPRRLPPLTTPSSASTRDRAHTAEALFARANAERSAGELQQALTAYETLAQAFPETRSGLASRISRAELLLRRLHSPAEALVAYRSYLTAAPDGPLAEQARVGVATCAQRLGQDDEERKAWLELLERHPGSLHAERARARLRVLSP